MGIPEHEASRSRLRVAVCHPELLLGQAVSAALGSMGFDVGPGVVTSPQSLLTLVRNGVDLAIVADSFGDELGELLEALAFRDSNLPVLVLGQYQDFSAAARALELGAMGSVSSSSALDTLSSAVLTAFEGHVVFLDGASDEVGLALEERRAERWAADALYHSLTDRERTIAQALADGRSAGEIAAQLSLSPHTVRAAIRRVGQKLDVTGQLRIAAACRDLLHAITPPSERFVRWRASQPGDSRAG